MRQKEFIEGCYDWYREADLQPGNPDDGEWQECHYPLPKCLGGTETILLLKEHHAIQGVLQSEEYQHPCIYGWEKHYCKGEYEELFKRWMVKKLESGFDKFSQAERAKRAGSLNVEKQRGWYNPETIEKRKKATSVAGMKQKEEGKGIHGLSKENRTRYCRLGGLAAQITQKENKLGIYGLTYEDRVRQANKANEHRKVEIILIHPDGTEERWESICSACRAYSLNRAQIQKILKKQTSGTSKGFSARYAIESTES